MVQAFGHRLRFFALLHPALALALAFAGCAAPTGEGLAAQRAPLAASGMSLLQTDQLVGASTGCTSHNVSDRWSFGLADINSDEVGAIPPARYEAACVEHIRLVGKRLSPSAEKALFDSFRNLTDREPGPTPQPN